MRLFPLQIVKVEGHSMEPHITSGSLLLVNAWAYLFAKPKIGDVVIFRMEKELLCKRIFAYDVERQTYVLRGDNPADSLDSRAFGAVTCDQIIGKIISIQFARKSDQ